MTEKLGFSTRQIHGGKKVQDLYCSHKAPIYRTSIFDFPSASVGAKRFEGKDKGYIYTRLGNPNFDQLASRIADLENGYPGHVYGSGMGAIHSIIFGLLGSNDHLITSDSLYGCTDSLFRNHLQRFGVKPDFIDTRRVENIARAVKKNTRIIYIETPANPTLRITDIRETAKIAEKAGAYLIVDNTFSTPYLQRPIDLGADIVVHSLTKDIGGHSDFIGGVSVYSRKFFMDEESMSKMDRATDDFGAVLSPEDAFLALRGLETLSIRMDRKCENAQALAEWLEEREEIAEVIYPGLRSFPQRNLARKQMSKPGDMIWFIMRGGYEAGVKLMDSVKLCSLSVSLGSTSSLIQHPASMTHKVVPKKQRDRIGIVAGGIRFSIGLEDKEDIIADLGQALDKL